MIGLVACCGRKLAHPAPAEELYRSPLFCKSVALVRMRCTEWAILSAKHGLVLPGDVIAPYEETLSSRSEVERIRWAAATKDAIIARWGAKKIFLVLAGRLYLAAVDGLHVIEPLQGMPIGRRLQYLAQCAR